MPSFQGHPPRDIGRTFWRHGPGGRELRPVVRQEDREDAWEHLEAEQRLKPMD